MITANLITKRNAAIFSLAFISAICAGVFFFSSAENYDDCILSGMRGTASNTAAIWVAKACRNKYPAKETRLNDFALSADQLSKITLTGNISIYSGNKYFGDIYNGNQNIKITKITIEINNSNSQIYSVDMDTMPLTVRNVYFDVHNLNSLNTHSIISARGVFLQTP